MEVDSMEKYKQELERRKQEASKEKELKRNQYSEMFFKIMLDNNIEDYKSRYYTKNENIVNG